MLMPLFQLRICGRDADRKVGADVPCSWDANNQQVLLTSTPCGKSSTIVPIMFENLTCCLKYSRDHLLIVDQLQLGFLKGQWAVMCDGFFNAGSLAKNTTTLAAQVRSTAA